MGKVVNLADSPGWVKKVTAFWRWLFFGSGEFGGWGYALKYRWIRFRYLSIYIDFFRVWKSLIACHPILVIFFRLRELVPAWRGLKGMGREVIFSL